MISPREIYHRAYMMGIRTGEMPNVSLIWDIQRQEGSQACFGQGRHCRRRQCRWRHLCLALDFYADEHLPIASPVSVAVVRSSTPPSSIPSSPPSVAGAPARIQTGTARPRAVVSRPRERVSPLPAVVPPMAEVAAVSASARRPRRTGTLLLAESRRCSRARRRGPGVTSPSTRSASLRLQTVES